MKLLFTQNDRRIVLTDDHEIWQKIGEIAEYLVTSPAKVLFQLWTTGYIHTTFLTYIMEK